MELFFLRGVSYTGFNIPWVCQGPHIATSLGQKGIHMTSGKQPHLSRQLNPKRDDNQPREGEADMERREIMLMQTGSVSAEGAGLDARLQAKIGRTLKAMFDEVATAPVPEKFVDLLNKLEALEKTK